MSEKPVKGARPKRANFGGPSLKLHADPIPGYHLCWMNDDGQTIQQAEAAGYEFVEDDRQDSNDPGRKVRRLVGKQEGGAPLYAFLMKIRQEFFEEDQNVIANRADLVDKAIKSGKPAQSQEGDKFYKTGVNMEVNTSRR